MCNQGMLNHMRKTLSIVLGSTMGFVVGCTPLPKDVDTTSYVPLSLAPAALAGVSDRRASFRTAFCSAQDTEAALSEEDCNSTLRRFRDEGDSAETAVRSPPEERRSAYRIAVALGIGWDCVRDFIDEEELPTTALRKLGYDAELMEVEGLSSSDKNADIVAASLLEDSSDQRPIILIGYSKGANDMMVALEKHPELASRTAAFVSVAGAVGGSPVAENDSGITTQLFHFSPYGDCDDGDGLAMESLRPMLRHAWLRDHLPLPVPSYSLVTAPEPSRVSRALRSSYKVLGVVHPINDGALLHWDQLLPGSSLLGYVNADHWAVSVPITLDNTPIPDFVISNDFPRTRLWHTIVSFVIADLAKKNPDIGVTGSSTQQ
ncbi:conserved hypothetical protein [gamma proteobacterium NOR5-3]|nr:conserved hypothetical protein [gamma proteobacterium NOR5-3]